jgi:hypothetical protein
MTDHEHRKLYRHRRIGLHGIVPRICSLQTQNALPLSITDYKGAAEETPCAPAGEKEKEISLNKDWMNNKEINYVNKFWL